jgi:peptide/nickel transport system substrate-binding protein
VHYPRSTLTAAILNLRTDRPEFQDARTRRALLLAVDRAAIVRDVLGGEGVVAAGPVPPSSPLYNAAAHAPLEFDPIEAATLLESAGWVRDDDGWRAPGETAGTQLEVATVDAAANALTHAVAQRAAADWRRLGLTVEVRPLSAGALATERLDPRQYDVAIVDVALGHDPDLYPLFVSSQAAEGGTNVSGFQSEALDALLESARAYAPADVRRARFNDLQRHLASELPLLPLVYADYPFLISDSLVGPTPREVATPQERYWDVLTWRTADGPDR